MSFVATKRKGAVRKARRGAMPKALVKRLMGTLGLARQTSRHMTAALGPVKLSSQFSTAAFTAFVDRFDSLARRAPAPRAGLAVPDFPVVEGDVAGLHLLAPAHEANRNNIAERVTGDRLRWRDIYLRHVMTGGGTFLDIGANVGLTSLPHALVGHFARIVAVEPDAENFACLVHNAALNGLADRVTCCQLAVGAACGTAELDVDRPPGRRFLRAKPRPKADPATSRRVEVTTLDKLIAAQSLAPDGISLVKCDTQGSEPAILAGAGDLLARRRAVWHMEVSVRSLNRAGSSPAELGRTLQTHFSHYIDTGTKQLEFKPVSRIQSDTIDALTARDTDVMLFP